jgi:hypothetical protein
MAGPQPAALRAAASGTVMITDFDLPRSEVAADSMVVGFIGIGHPATVRQPGDDLAGTQLG